MGKDLQPLLAAKIDDVSQLEQLHYPMFVSPKLDGIRLRIDPILGGVSRTHKSIPNQHIQNHIASNSWMHYLDGEVIIGSPVAPDVFNKTQSAVMTHSGEPSWSYYVFDDWRDPQTPYADRLRYAQTAIPLGHEHNIDIHFVTQNLCDNPTEVLRCEERYLTQGYEGIIIRSTNGVYKNGRSTLKQETLLKFKRVQDSEAQVVGFEPLRRNTNEATKDAFGHQRRSSHQAGKLEDNLLGALVVVSPTWGQFTIGSGFDEATRYEIWLHQDKYMGKTVTFKYQAVGMLNKPRFPIWKGFRHD